MLSAIMLSVVMLSVMAPCCSSTVVECSTMNRDIKGSNPACRHHQQKTAEKCDVVS